MNYNYAIGAYSFTLGSVILTWDAVTVRPINRKYLVGCLLFDVGCLCFALDAHKISIFNL